MVVLKQLGAEPELAHRHATLTLKALTNQVVTSIGVGGAEVIQLQSVASKLYKKSYIHDVCISLAARETILGTLMLAVIYD